MAESYFKRYTIVNGINTPVKINYSNTGTYFNETSSPSLTKYNTAITPMGHTVISPGYASTGNYAVFAGGYNTYTGNAANYSQLATYAYNSSLTRFIPTALTFNFSFTQSVSFKNYAMFGSRTFTTLSGTAKTLFSNTLQVYDDTLTKKTVTNLASNQAYSPSGASIDNYALFAGGGPSYDASINKVVAYDSALTRTAPTALSIARHTMGSTTVGGYALFAGGSSNGSSASNRVDAYSSTLVRSTPTALSYNTTSAIGFSVGEYGVFSGGYDSANSSYPNYFQIYDNTLTKTIGYVPYPVGTYSAHAAPVKFNNYAVFRGIINNSVISNSAFLMDSTLTILSPFVDNLTMNLYQGAAAVGNYIVYAGGSNASNTSSNMVEALYIEPGAATNGYRITTPTIMGLNTYNYNFTSYGIGTVGPNVVLQQSTPFTGYLEMPSTINAQ